jgi:hypothetical protein
VPNHLAQHVIREDGGWPRGVHRGVTLLLVAYQ